MTEFKNNKKRPRDETDAIGSGKKLKKANTTLDIEKDQKVKKVFKPSQSKFKGKQFPNGKTNKYSKPQPQTLEKPSWNELKSKKKELKIQRKKNKTKENYEVSVQAKKIYEELKQKGSKTNKDVLCKELHALMQKSDYSKLSLSHDIARVVQCLFKKAPLNIKTEIAEKLIPTISQICMSKYGKFCVSRLMTYCGKDMREKAITGMFGNVVKMTSHVFSNSIIDVVYLNHASPDQKLFLKQEFYSDLYKNDKNKKVVHLRDTWAGSDILKKGILNSTKLNLTKIASKNLVDNSLVHAVLLEFIEEADETNRQEIVAAYIPHLAAIASTKQGSRAAVLSYLYSVAKERRAMLKALKEHVTKLCIHEHGHLLILTILNSTDDTQMIKKILFPTIVSDIEKIVNNEWGKRVLEWIVSPSSKDFFHPTMIGQLDECLTLGNQKKDADIRRKELIDGIEESLCEAIKTNPNFWLKGGHTARVTVSVLHALKCEASAEVYDALCKIICDTEWKIHEKETFEEEVKVDESVSLRIPKKKKSPFEKQKTLINESELLSGIEHPGMHIALKKIAKADKDKVSSNSPTFGSSLTRELNEETLKMWIKINRACFLLVEVFENADDEVKEKLRMLIKEHKAVISKQKHAGAKILLQKINN